MEKVRFECRIGPSEPNGTGADQVIYYFSPNPGEDLQPLAGSASGGEMSRFLLALKSCFSQLEKGVNTLIFDEIDAGVSGKVAQAIATKLHQLSQNHQILCVTHQPLIAAMADVHFRVEKETIQENNSDLSLRTVIRVQPLKNHHTRREELAQLTGGHSAAEAIAFADSLLTQAATKRKIRK
jgi:DNA repair protein RecN (Recombination protein N)